MAVYSKNFLPTIKCSQCSRDIEISQMGDHICRPGGEPSPPPESYANFDSIPYKKSFPNNSANSKPGRAMPPRVDTFAANRPFFRQDELTPLSMSPASVSPMTPNNERFQAPYGRPSVPMRSATSPAFPQPSPDLRSSNLDCAFPPFPTTTSKPIPITREGGYGGLGKTDPMFAPVSPRNVSGGGLLQRMNTIAPGPFGVNGRRNADEQQNGSGHQRQKSMKTATQTLDAGIEIIRPSTSSGHTRNSSSRVGLPRAPKKETYGGFGGRTADDDPRPELLRPEDRSQTFPLQNEITPFRRPSESAMRTPSPSERSNENFDQPRKASVGPDLSRDLPRRGASIYRPRNDRSDSRLGDAPPVPGNVNLAAEFGVGNPYHTPSGSQSSTAGSGYSEVSKTSSRSSPSSSAPDNSPRKPSIPTNIDLEALMSEVQSSMADLRPREITPSSPPRKLKEQLTNKIAPRSLAPAFLSLESPMDQAIQGGRLSPLPPKSTSRPQVYGSPTELSPISPKRPTATRSKGNCKGCTKPITGKSISSADGRLTGRYHKECFACTTCLEPFKTSTFYVIDDAPYCDWHYHKLNGSVCDTCDKGIEGQYLESERKKKFHPGCLTCADCKRTLRHDYFEENGRVYCERDAFRRAQRRQFLGPKSGTNKMERRTTRLMMM